MLFNVVHYGVKPKRKRLFVQQHASVVIISGYWPTFTISFTPDCLRSMYKSIADGNVFARYALAPNVAADDTSKPRPSALV